MQEYNLSNGSQQQRMELYGSGDHLCRYGREVISKTPVSKKNPPSSRGVFVIFMAICPLPHEAVGK